VGYLKGLTNTNQNARIPSSLVRFQATILSSALDTCRRIIPNSEESRLRNIQERRRWQGKGYERRGKQVVVGVGIVERSGERNSYEVLFELRQENRETHSIQGVRFLLRTMPRIVHGPPMSAQIITCLSKEDSSFPLYSGALFLSARCFSSEWLR